MSRWCIVNSFHFLQLFHSHVNHFPAQSCPFHHVFLCGLCLLSRAAESLELAVALEPFHLCFKPFLSLLVCIDIKWDLPGAWIKFCWIQIEVVKWPYYPLTPAPALEIRVQELVACPVCNLYWIYNSSYKIFILSSLHTHTYSPSAFTVSRCDV